jgi:hypothetical protein
VKTYEIKAREIGGWRLRLLEDGEEMGGGVFDTEDDAVLEGLCWTVPALLDAPTVESIDAQILELGEVRRLLIEAAPPHASGAAYTPEDVKRFGEAIARVTQRYGFLCVERAALATGGQVSGESPATSN